MESGALKLASILQSLQRVWTPHDAQRLILQKIFKEYSDVTFVECGRKFGKTELVAYFLWRMALISPGQYYYFAPEQKQAREILWAPGRLQKFGPSEYVAQIKEQEMRIILTNGSFIKVDGSDNFNSHRGTEPHGIAYDEFRDFKPEFHAVMGPNLSVHKAPLLLTTTPPERDIEHYDALLLECRAAGSSFNYPSWANPYLDAEWLKKEKAKLYARGEGDVWEREYGARRVRGGSKSIFPMFDKAKHVMPHNELMRKISNDMHKLDWYCIADPANMSTFGVLFAAHNSYSKDLYILGEIYEKSQLETSTGKMVPRCKKMRLELYPLAEAAGKDWFLGYDEAASWYATEAVATWEEPWMPTSKAVHDKDEGLSLIKDQMLSRKALISDACPSLIWEVENYIKDKNGKPIKEADHLIDCWRYLNYFTGASYAHEDEPSPKEPWRRYHTPESDAADEAEEVDNELGSVDDY